MAAERYPHSASPARYSLSKYMRRFTFSYLGLSVLIAIIFTVIDYEPPSAVGFLALWGAANIAGYAFFNDNQRLPEKAELRKFSLFGLLAAYTLTAIVFGFLIAIDDGELAQLIESLPGWIFIAIVLVIAIPVYFACSLGFSMGAKAQLKAKKPSSNSKEIL